MDLLIDAIFRRALEIFSNFIYVDWALRRFEPDFISLFSLGGIDKRIAPLFGDRDHCGGSPALAHGNPRILTGECENPQRVYASELGCHAFRTVAIRVVPTYKEKKLSADKGGGLFPDGVIGKEAFAELCGRSKRRRLSAERMGLI